MNLKEFSETKTFTGILYGVGIVLFVLVIFQAGVYVGYHKAGFSIGRDVNYYRAYGDRGMFVMGIPPEDLENGHGAVGKIVKVDLPTVIVEGPDNTEKVVMVDSQTEVREFRNVIKVDDLKTGDYVVALGTPNDEAQVVAKLIRIMPAPPSSTTTNIYLGR